MRALILLVLIALPMAAMAQQRTIYGATGKAVARSTIDSQGTVTTYGADGRAITRETRDGTVYDSQSGRVIGKEEKRR